MTVGHSSSDIYLSFCLSCPTHRHQPDRDTQAVCMVSDVYTVYIHIIIVLVVMENTMNELILRDSFGG